VPSASTKKHATFADDPDMRATRNEDIILAKYGRRWSSERLLRCCSPAPYHTMKELEADA